MDRISYVLLVSAAFWSASGLAWGQEARATLGGRVIDPQGIAVPGANVVVTSEDTGVKQQTLTNSQGNWLVQFLIPGRYGFSVSAPGFREAERRGITLQTADNKLIDTRLEIGTSTQQITVTSEAPLIDTTSATSGTVIAPQQITEMPSMSRVTTLLTTLSPGVMAQDQNTNIVHLYSFNASSEFTANGGTDNVRSNNFELDGMPDIKSGGYAGYMPPPDAVQEFRVQMNGYDASIGRQAGSTVQMSLKSGTAIYHGGLYEFNQNSMLNANLFQTNLIGGAVPPTHFNEYGGNFGGPAWIPKVYNGKQKSFFFLSYDGLRNITPKFKIRSVPTALEREGDFTQSFTTQLVGGQRVKYPIQVFDPASVDAKGNRQTFPDMQIPASRQSTIAQNVLKYVPLPNTASDPSGNAINNFVPNSTTDGKMADVAVRGDQTWNNSQKTFADLTWYHWGNFNVSNDFHDPATGTFQFRVAMGAGVDHVWTISPTKVLDMRFNVSAYNVPQHDNGAGFDPTQLGFPSAFVAQLQKPSFPNITGLFGNIGTSNAGNYTNNRYYTWRGNFTQVKGNMTLHYGAEYWVLQQANAALGAQEKFAFGTDWTRQNATVAGGPGVGYTMASFMLGLPQSGSAPFNASGLYSQHFYGTYIQDDWRVTPKLTINLGLRWDLETPVTERFDRMTSNFDPTAVNPISSAAQAVYANILGTNPGNAAVQELAQLLPASAFRVLGAQLFAGVNGQNRGVFNPDYRQVQPRIGFAYRLGPHTVIRGGAGRFDQASYVNGGQNGFSRTTDFIATQNNYFTPYDTLADPFRGGILLPTGSSLGPLTNLGQGVDWVNQNPSRMYSWEYSLHLQQEFKGWLFEAGYTHNKTYNVWGSLNQNLPSFTLWNQLQAPQFDANGRPLDLLMWNQLVPNPFYQLPGVTGTIAGTKTVALHQLLNPISVLGAINESNCPWGTTQYDALLAKVERRFTKGFSVITAFTWSKLFEDDSFLGPEIAHHVNHMLGGQDRPFHLSVAPIWEVPVGRDGRIWRSMPKALNVVLGGWEISGQYTIQSGLPVVFSTDSFFSGQDFALPRNQQSLSKWFDTSQFVAFPARNTNIANYPAWTGIQSLPGYDYTPAHSDSIKNGVYQDFSNYIRNYPTSWSDVRASRVNNVDAGIYKNFQIWERLKLQYRFEVYNAFNHPRFPAPNTNPAAATFGVVNPVEENQARSVQMALKVNF